MGQKQGLYTYYSPRASSVSIGLFGHKVIQVGADGHLYTGVYRFRRETQVCKAISQTASLLETKILFLPFKAICFTNILKLFQNKEQLVTYKINRKCRGCGKYSLNIFHERDRKLFIHAAFFSTENTWICFIF